MGVKSTAVRGRCMGSNPSPATLLLCDHMQVTQPLWPHFLTYTTEIINSPSGVGVKVQQVATSEALKTVPEP